MLDQFDLITRRGIDRIPGNSQEDSDGIRITCMDVSCEIMVYATNTGMIYFYCLDEKNCTPFFVADHGQPVMEIQLWTNGAMKYSSKDRRYMPADDTGYTTYYFAVSTCINGYVKFWNFFKRKQIKFIDEPLGRMLATSSAENTLCGIPPKTDHCYTAWNGVISCYSIASESIKLKWKYELIADTDPIDIVAIYPLPERILTFDHETNTTICYRIYESESLNVKKLGDTKQLPDNIISASVIKFRFLNHCIIACIADHLLALSVLNQSWMTYNIYDHLSGQITSLYLFNKDHPALHSFETDAVQLYIGTDAGCVYMMKIKCIKDWSNLDFSHARLMKQDNDGPVRFLNSQIGTYDDFFFIHRFIAGTSTTINFREYYRNGGWKSICIPTSKILLTERINNYMTRFNIWLYYKSSAIILVCFNIFRRPLSWLQRFLLLSEVDGQKKINQA